MRTGSGNPNYGRTASAETGRRCLPFGKVDRCRRAGEARTPATTRTWACSKSLVRIASRTAHTGTIHIPRPRAESDQGPGASADTVEDVEAAPAAAEPLGDQLPGGRVGAVGVA
ncbi:hypothetical protein [Nocardia sp. AG03]|uniref:hypothetical protein n=1 Tax=Nocardia sp. AG03 TaxID=3025312 RepID=UPI00241816C8|nr:hypothetical protein [Nocardia sp. AG03]